MNMVMATENNQRDQTVLTGTRVLVVEDEFYIADDLNRALTGAGATVVGPLASVSKAEEAVQSRSFDCAILDLNLRGESAVSIAEHLWTTVYHSRSQRDTAARPSPNICVR